MTLAESDILEQLRAWKAAGSLTDQIGTSLIAAWYRSAESGDS